MNCTTASGTAAPVVQALSRLNTDRGLLPSLQTERTKALLLCRRIAQVQIRDAIKVNGVMCYTLQIFYRKPSSNIPTRQQHEDTTTKHCLKPDRVTFQRFAAFVTLSHELRYHAHAGHVSNSCDFCKATITTIRSERPRIRTKLFNGDEAICKELERFVNATLTLVQNQLKTSPENCCDGQHEAPMLVARFLTETFDPLIVYGKK